MQDTLQTAFVLAHDKIKGQTFDNEDCFLGSLNSQLYTLVWERRGVLNKDNSTHSILKEIQHIDQPRKKRTVSVGGT